MIQNGIIISCSAGGLQASFVAGAMARLIEIFQHRLYAVTDIFASSASVANIFYYLSYEHAHPGEEICTQAIPRSAFRTGKTWQSLRNKRPIYDINVLVDVIFKNKYPLNIEKIKRTAHHFIFPIYNHSLHQIEFFSNHPERAAAMFSGYIIRDWRYYDIYSLIKAACAVPILFDQTVRLGDYDYCDAGHLVPFLVPHENLDYKAIYIQVKSPHIWNRWFNSLIVMGCGLMFLCFTLFKRAGLDAKVYRDVISKPLRMVILEKKLNARFRDLVLVQPSIALHNSAIEEQTSGLEASLKKNWQLGTQRIDQLFSQLNQVIT